ncbi:MAG: site-2 protease family protein [Defluviitaleaceae bacterium]|nr:site-2 protease family protein [Defluviitaleaceae bacterium]
MNTNMLLYQALAAVVTITVHEFVKAFISHSLGDPLPKRDKRVTPNPLKHIEPIGFIIMVALGFGWGKPVETASIYYKNKRNGTLLTYTIPSVVNLLLGIIMYALLIITSGTSRHLELFFLNAALFNIRHAFFNIVPVYPLDGAKVLSVLRDPNFVITMANRQMFYQLALVLFIVWGIVGRIIDPIAFSIFSFVGRILAGF